MAVDWQVLGVELGKLFLAALIGGLLGLERELHGQAAGLRTYIVVCLGACLMMLLSLHMEEIYRTYAVDQSVVRLDPGRIASYAIASMGFLGAGAIITGKGTVRGLTTAAGLWLVTGIGLSVGAGHIAPAVAATLISLIILYGLRRIKAIFPREEHTLVTLKYSGTSQALRQIKQIMAEHQVNINFINYQMQVRDQTVIYRLRLQSQEDRRWGQILHRLQQTPNLLEIRWEEGEVP